jgi:hypothetical protein
MRIVLHRRAAVLTAAVVVLLGAAAVPASPAVAADGTPRDPSVVSTTASATTVAADVTGTTPTAATTTPETSSAPPVVVTVTATATETAAATATETAAPAPMTTSSPPAPPAPAAASTTSAVPSRVLLAGANVIGALAISPATGSNFTAPDVSAKGNVTCPTGTTSMLGFVVGPNADWAEDKLIVVSNPSNFGPGQPIAWPFRSGFEGLAAENNIKIAIGRYDVYADCEDDLGTSLGQLTAPIWFTDPTKYVTTDPTTTTLTTNFAGLALSPADTVEIGQTATVTATLDQPGATGTIQFRQRTGSDAAVPVGSPVAVVNGTATATLPAVGAAIYFYSATFTPANAQRYTAASSDEVAYAGVLPVPPTPPDSASISGASGARAAVGTALTCSSGAFTNATTTTYRWRRDFVLVDGATAQTYTPTSDDAGHELRCEAVGTRTVATVPLTSGRISGAVEVTA